MSKLSNAGFVTAVAALVLTNPTVRKGTAKLLRKAAKFLDEPYRPLPVAPPPMWSSDPLPDPLDQQPEEESVSSRLSLKDFQANH